jgi:protein AbiQ
LKKTGSRPINTDLLPESSNPQNKKINFSVFNKGCTRGVNSNHYTNYTQKIIAYTLASVYNNHTGESYLLSGIDMRVFRCDGYYQEAMWMHSLLCCGGIMSKRFKLYNVNMKYIRNLHRVDDNVPSVSPQAGKQTRPFLGIVVLVNGSKFCIPFTSNSDKKAKNFESMRENITFRKIRDKNGKVLAALNLNNMIPVREEYITEIDLKIRENDRSEIIRWKRLCLKELNWCQSNQNEIERLANELYRIYSSNEPFGKKKICLNFPALEAECNKAPKL